MGTLNSSFSSGQQNLRGESYFSLFREKRERTSNYRHSLWHVLLVVFNALILSSHVDGVEWRNAGAIVGVDDLVALQEAAHLVVGELAVGAAQRS